MSSQTPGINLQHAPDSRGYRLLELPAELQQLLESDNPPILKLDSSSSSAVLRSPQKTYALRQKNTSNAVLLLAPAEHQHQQPSSSSAEAAAADQLGPPGLAAIATVHETVELDPVKADPADPGAGPVKHTGSRGRWHEKFGRGR